MSARTKIAAISLAAALGIAVWFHFEWVEWSGPALKAQRMWRTIEEASRSPQLSSDAKPVGSLDKGELVDVLWDRYGKDYWACYIKVRSGLRGWVLCTDLGIT